jgi:hypothetical protein
MDIGAILATGGTIAAIYFVVAIALIGLQIWVAYTIIWRAVRRGLREHDLNPTGARGPRREERYRGNPRNW